MSENKRKNIRAELIVAGIHELNSYGLQNFSVRRIANECGVSCAAPYKHFKDRQNFVAAIIKYVNTGWGTRQSEIMEAYPSDIRKQLVEISVDYVRFLVENPYFRSIIMLKDESFDNEYGKLRGILSETSRCLIRKYCVNQGISKETRRRKTYIIRSLIYGAALMFDNGEMTYNEENMSFVRYSIDREFDLD